MSGATLALSLLSLAAIVGVAVRPSSTLRSQRFATPLKAWDICNEIECPVYTSVHKEGAFEVRLYGDATWIETFDFPAMNTFLAAMEGKRPVMEYWLGRNSKSAQVKATAPIVTTARRPSGTFSVRALIPSESSSNPPKPDTDSHVKLVNITRHCVVAATFPDNLYDVDEEVRQLAEALEGTPWEAVPRANPSSLYAAAQYVNLKGDFPVTFVHDIWFSFVANGDDCIPDKAGLSAL